MFPFSVFNLSGLILVHAGESVLSELAFVPGKKQPKLKKKKEGNKHPLKSLFGSKGGRITRQTSPAAQPLDSPPALGRNSPAHHAASALCSSSPHPARKNC